MCVAIYIVKYFYGRHFSQYVLELGTVKMQKIIMFTFCLFYLGSSCTPKEREAVEEIISDAQQIDNVVNEEIENREKTDTEHCCDN